MRNEKTLIRIVEQYGDMLWHVCTGYGLDRAYEVRDAYQEVLVALWSDMDNLRESEFEKTWVYRVATNTMLMLVRKQHRCDTGPLPPNVEEMLSEEPLGPIRMDYANLLKLIDGMEEPDGRIVRAHLDGFSFKEIGRDFGMSENAAAQRYHRTIQKIRQQYENEF